MPNEAVDLIKFIDVTGYVRIPLHMAATGDVFDVHLRFLYVGALVKWIGHMLQ